MKESLRQWLDRMPELRTDCDPLLRTYERSLVDLAALRFYPDRSDEPVLSAGLPWFMALFGRDNLIAAYQTCHVAPDLAACILRTLGKRQGTVVDNFRDEEPGKIPHEQRFGELTLLGRSPHGPYYGTVDATPLYLVLLHEVYRWTGDRNLVNELWENALRCLDWIDRHGDLDGDGYVEYLKRSSEGLDNQCWKDSWNSILFSDGSLARPPIAVCEVQGYVYLAKLGIAALARDVRGDDVLASRLLAEAAELKRRFDRDFWIADRGGYYAIALDRDKRKVDSLTSNLGQLLWTGIVPDEKARLIADQLMSDALFTGWGIRTMSWLDRGFNPIEYHNGTVWPHDNSLIAAGLARYGFHDEASRIILAHLEAARYFAYRLPEAFAGYHRARIDFPVEYPTASSPQAWATAAPILFIRTLLGLDPDPELRTLRMDPRLPQGIGRLELRNLRLFGRTFAVEVAQEARVTAT